jgi:hypothetical protein
MLSRRMSLALVITILCWNAAEAQTAGNQAGFLFSGQTATLDCAGGKAEVIGSNNVLTIKGGCTGLDLSGSTNKITIEFGPGAAISFVGSGNAIVWSSNDGKPPKVSYVGANNTITPPISPQ